MENSPTCPAWLPVVALALHDGEGRWLMHRRPAGKHHGGLWEFPGGKVEMAEIPSLALIREAAEELGIVVAAADLVPVGFADGGLLKSASSVVLFLYECCKWQGTPAPLEGGRLAWCALDEIERLPMPPLDQVLFRQLAQKHA